MMAVSICYDLKTFSAAAASIDPATQINSMCTVSAESEVVSLKNSGMPPAEISRAVCLAVVNRLATIVRKVGYGDHLVFTGGFANSPVMISLLEQELGVPVHVPDYHTITGALGAALQAKNSTFLKASHFR